MFYLAVAMNCSTNFRNSHLEWLVNLQRRMESSDLPIWDSFYPVAEAAMQDCVNAPPGVPKPPHPDLRFTPSWQCYDWAHCGRGATVIAAQMIINDLCNQYLPSEGYCCEGHRT